MKKGVRDAAWLKIKLTISREGVCVGGGGGGPPRRGRTRHRQRAQVPAPFGSGGPVQCSKEGAYIVVPHPSSSIVLYRPKRGTALPGERKSSLTRGIVAQKGSHGDPPTPAENPPNTRRKPAEHPPETRRKPLTLDHVRAPPGRLSSGRPLRWGARAAGLRGCQQLF